VILLAAAGLRAAEPTAHDPQYDNREVWPAWVEKTNFIREKWDRARVLVWKETQKRYQRHKDAGDPSLWQTKDGGPAQARPDEHTDLVIPPGNYTIAGGGGISCRHLTVGAGVRVSTGIRLYGNCWLKKGASFRTGHLAGDRHNFMRNDDGRMNRVANKIAFNKSPEQSTEWLGGWQTGDELDLFSGTFIVGPGGTFQPGDRSTQHVYPKAKLVLLSGATFHKRGNQYGFNEIEIEGTVLAGTPDRPLTKDAVLGLSWKPRGVGNPHNSSRGDRGLILYKQGVIAVHSADPEEARLVFRWHRLPTQSFAFKGGEPPEVKALPHGIDFLLLGKTQFDGVEFQDTLAGGILMPDPSARQSWKHVTFGKGNFAEPEKLFAQYTGKLDIDMRDSGVAAGLAKQADAEKEQEQE
jgi:hypothetical protein